MKRELETRLSAVEGLVEYALRPPLAILSGPDGAERSALDHYYRATPSNKQAVLVIFIRKFGKEARNGT